MEEKMELLLERMDKIDEKIGTMDNKMNKMNDELNEKMDRMNDELNKKMDKMNVEINQKIDHMQEEIREVKDQQFLFEHDYGTKIDAIFDAVTMELDKNLEKSEKIRKLEGRMDRSDVKSFSYEKRILDLELKS